ncbi:hypothetical protein [Achromobacter xylosoxidans]|uniref:hypothetical protein n=1 Tax=Alcaligenes xylosoxydans xylosoxydans TaxID=85698 RepID=UPI002A75CA9E|nr:hypothetical protein [Achromobacter xylosoxidans]WPQ35129.1 hypothetical protein SLH34_31765 [Achromobacter xylosoxidans]
MKTVVVSTKEGLRQAKDKGAESIEVVGEMADKLKKAKRIATFGPAAMAAITGLLGVASITAVPTGGLSYVAFAAAATPVAALTGLEIATIIFAATIGLAVIVAVFKDYEEISYSKGHLVLRKRSK